MSFSEPETLDEYGSENKAAEKQVTLEDLRKYTRNAPEVHEQSAAAARAFSSPCSERWLVATVQLVCSRCKSNGSSTWTVSRRSFTERSPSRRSSSCHAKAAARRPTRSSRWSATTGSPWAAGTTPATCCTHTAAGSGAACYLSQPADRRTHACLPASFCVLRQRGALPRPNELVPVDVARFDDTSVSHVVEKDVMSEDAQRKVRQIALLSASANTRTARTIYPWRVEQILAFGRLVDLGRDALTGFVP